MKRHSSMYRGQRRFWLARTIIARQPLMAHLARHQQLVRAFGLIERTGETAQLLSTPPERRFVGMQRDALPSARPVLRPPLAAAEQPTEQPDTESTGSKVSASTLEVPLGQREGSEHLLKIDDSGGTKVNQEQKRADAHTQPKEIAEAKRPRGRIEEQVPEAGYISASPPAPSANVARQGSEGEQALEKSDARVAVPDSEVSEVGELFAPGDTDRSPQAWLRRLSEAARSAAHEDSSLSQERPSSAPLSQRTRRFLQPLVGIDLTGIRLYRDAIAERLTDAYQADAVTVGDDVELATGHPDDTPGTLGLLAHEFTHVARQRESRFIPPIARSMSPAPSRVSWPSSADDETLAQQVESQVKRMAQEQVDQVTPVATKPIAHPTSVTSPAQVPRSTRDTWGGLPAPWEPLPDWLITLPATAESRVGQQAPVVTSQPSHIAQETDSMSGTSEAIGSGSRGTNVSPVDTGVQRAGRERSLDGEEEQEVTSRTEVTKTPEPDLDQLARQVYSLLKRRLSVEYRRES